MTLHQERVRECTIFIHGIRSHGQGFDKLVEELREDPDFPYERHRLKVYDHGYTYPWETWSNGTKQKLMDGIGGFYHKQMRKYPYVENVNIIAHSYGTWGISHYLKQTESAECNVDTLLLINSVVEKNFDWSYVIHEKNMVNSVGNLLSRWDWVPALGRLGGVGMSGDYMVSSWFGDYGFNDTAKGHVENIVIPGGHTWYKTEDGIELMRATLKKKCKWVGDTQQVA